MDKAAALHRPPIVQRLVQSIEDETGMRCPIDTPANDAPGEYIDAERHIDKALPRRHVGEIGYPEHVRRRRLELTIDAILWARGRLVADRRPDRLAADCALQTHAPHQSLHRAAGNLATLPL